VGPRPRGGDIPQPRFRRFCSLSCFQRSQAKMYITWLNTPKSSSRQCKARTRSISRPSPLASTSLHTVRTHHVQLYDAHIVTDIENWHGELRYGYDAKVTTQDLVEFYLPTFKACVRDAKGASLMTSYNAVNGVPTSASGYFVGEIARGRWGFDSYVTSDCDAVSIHSAILHANSCSRHL
jgi:hypothetical protein